MYKMVEKGYIPLIRPKGYGTKVKASMLTRERSQDKKTLQSKRNWRRLLWSIGFMVWSEIKCEKDRDCRVKIGFKMSALQPENLDYVFKKREYA